MPRIIKNGIEYTGSIPPLGDGLKVNSSTGKLEVETATDADIAEIINSITQMLDNQEGGT